MTRAPVVVKSRRQEPSRCSCPGLDLAGYLGMWRRKQVAAVCVPVGTATPSSKRVCPALSLPPIAVLGVLGYTASAQLGRWRGGAQPVDRAARLAMVGMVWFGMASPLPDVLEQIVIGATCAGVSPQRS